MHKNTIRILLGTAFVCVSADRALRLRSFSIRSSSRVATTAFNVGGIGDVNADGVPDIATANHRFHTENGRVEVRSGVDGSPIWQVSGDDLGGSVLGFSMAVIGDVNGDGAGDMASSGIVFSGADGTVLYAYSGDDQVLEGVGDLDNDGTPDFVSGNDAHSGVDGTSMFSLGFGCCNNGGVTGPGDINGDGHRDFVVAYEPNPGPDEIRVYSGIDGLLVRTDTPPDGGDIVQVLSIGDLDTDGAFDYAVKTDDNLYLYSGLFGTLIQTLFSVPAGSYFDLGDVDGDGFHELGVNGSVDSIIDLPSGVLLGTIAPPGGGAGGLLGLDIAALGDLDGDGLGDFAVGQPFSGGIFEGAIHVYRFDVAAPVSTCTPKLNSAGCLPTVSTIGVPRISGSTPFTINAVDVNSFSPGIFFYGYGQTDVPFLGGTLCALPPIRRTQVQSSFGQVPGTCEGTFAFDFAAHAANGTDPNLTAGAAITGQFWSRDPFSSFGTSLTDATSFTVGD